MHRYKFDRLQAALRRDHRRIALLTALYTVTGPAAAVLVIKNLWRILAAVGQTDFADVFAALRHAPLWGPIPFAVLVSLLCALGVCWLRDAGKKKTAVAVGILLWMVWFLSCLLLVNVNDVAFGRVLFSLLQGLQNGLADAL